MIYHADLVLDIEITPMQPLNRNTVKELLKKRNFKKTLVPFEVQIRDLIPFSESFSEALFCIHHEIRTKPMCGYCQVKPKGFRYYGTGLGYYSSGCCEDHTKRLNNLEKYGVENISSLPQIKSKKIETCIENHGVANPKQNKVIADKIKNTMHEKYGGFGKAGILREKIETTCIEKMGCTNPMDSVEYRGKMKKVLFDKILDRLSEHVIADFTYTEYRGCQSEYPWICVKCGTKFNGKIDAGAIPRCNTCFPRQSKSLGETELFNFVQSLDKKQGDRTLLENFEIDISVPSKKLAIEFNGIYWHSESRGRGKDYHIRKTESCEKLGIQLLHIFETEWNSQKEQIKSIINGKLNLFSNIYDGELCKIEEISIESASNFLDVNSLQLDKTSDLFFGMFHNGKLVSTIGVSSIGNNEFLIGSCCTELHSHVLNGYSKLVNHIIFTLKAKKLIVNVDRRFWSGNTFKDCGFNLVGVQPPQYFLLWKNNIYNGSELSALYPEVEVDSLDKVWDCGNRLFEWRDDCTD